MIKLAIKTGIVGIALALAFSFIFLYGLYGTDPGEVMTRLAAEVGTQVKVLENPHNRVAHQLAEKEEELEKREEELGLLLKESERNSERIIHLMLALLSLLFILLISNFYLDFKARKADKD